LRAQPLGRLIALRASSLDCGHASPLRPSLRQCARWGILLRERGTAGCRSLACEAGRLVIQKTLRVPSARGSGRCRARPRARRGTSGPLLRTNASIRSSCASPKRRLQVRHPISVRKYRRSLLIPRSFKKRIRSASASSSVDHHAAFARCDSLVAMLGRTPPRWPGVPPSSGATRRHVPPPRLPPSRADANGDDRLGARAHGA
jgi:hypothetical protein